MGRSTTMRCTFTAAALAVVFFDGFAAAADRFWNDPKGGTFSAAANWDDGTLPPPGLGDTAIFDLDAAYDVLFFMDALTDRAIIRRGDVIFLFSPASEYGLIQPSATAPSLLIGDIPSQAAGLTVKNGGGLETIFVSIAEIAGSVAALTLHGTELTALEEIRVGTFGTGELSVSDGSTIESLSATVAVATDSVGTVLLDGAGSSWDIVDLLTIGQGGDGEMTITGGAGVTSDGGIIAQQAQSNGSLLVSGSNSNWFSFGSIDVGLFTPGSMTVEDGANVLCLEFLSLSTFSEDPEEFSTLAVRDRLSSVLVFDDLLLGLVGNGELRLGEGGRVEVDGDLMESAGGESRIFIELSDQDDYAVPAIFVAGIADSFEITVDLVKSFAPQEGDRFEILEALNGAGNLTFTLPPLTPPLAWQVQQDGTLHSLLVISQAVPGDVNGDGVVDFTDLLLVISDWGPCAGCASDLDGDGIVGFTDLLLVLHNWTE